MSVGNYGAVKNQLEGFVGIALGATTQRSNQGVAMVPDLLNHLVTRPDFANTLNAKLSISANTTTGVDLSATAGTVLGIVWDNSQAATDAYIVFFGVVKGSVTLGTTNPSLAIFALRNSQGALVVPAGTFLTNTGLSWDATTNIYAGATRSTVSTVTVGVVYAA